MRDLEVSGRPVTLIWERRRLVCEPCGSRFSEGRQGFEGRVTARLARRLVKDARAMTVNAAAKRRQVGWKLVNALVVAWAGLVGEHRRRQKCRVLGVDETSICKRHRCVTVIINGDTGEVLAMVPHRDAQALSGFLAVQGPRWCKAVKVVVCDGSAAYKAAIEARLGHARHVLDRFADIYRTGHIPEFSDTVDTFLAWHNQIRREESDTPHPHNPQQPEPSHTTNTTHATQPHLAPAT